MAVQSDTSRIQYAGNNSTSTSYAVPFVFLENSHLKAIARTSAGVESVVTLTNHTGAGNVNGGTVRTTVAIPATSTLIIYREVPATQTTSYQEGGDFPATSHERALDKLTMLTQQNARGVQRSVKFPEGENANTVLPAAVSRANKAMGFGADGAVAVSSSTLAQIDGAVSAVNTIASSPSGSAGVAHIAAGVGAVATTVQAKLRETVSVKDFGAVGNGVADDTTAITAAIAALTNGGRVYFPQGHYRITSTITITGKPILIEGDGAADGYTSGTSIIVDTPNTSGLMFRDARNHGLSKITVQGPSGTARLTGGSLVEAGAGVFGFSVEDCMFQRGYNGITLFGGDAAAPTRGGFGFQMRGCRVRIISGDYCIGCITKDGTKYSWQVLTMESCDTSAGDHLQLFKYNAISVQNVSNDGGQILVTTSKNHGLVTGDRVNIASVSGVSAANGFWVVTRVSATQFRLNGSAFSGTYSSGGIVRPRTFKFGAFTADLSNITCLSVNPTTWVKTPLVQTTDYTITQQAQRVDITLSDSVSVVDNGTLVCRKVGGLRGVGTTLIYFDGRTGSHKIVNSTGGFSGDGYWFRNTTEFGQPAFVYIANGGLENCVGSALRIETGSDYKISNTYFNAEEHGLDIVFDPAGSQNISTVTPITGGVRITTSTPHNLTENADVIVSGISGTNINFVNGRYPSVDEDAGIFSAGFSIVDSTTIDLFTRLRLGILEPVAFEEDTVYTSGTGNIRGEKIVGTGNVQVSNSFFRGARKSGVRIDAPHIHVVGCRVRTSGAGDKNVFSIDVDSVANNSGTIRVTTKYPHRFTTGDLFRFGGLKKGGVEQLSYVYGSVTVIDNVTLDVSATGLNPASTATVSMAWNGPYDTINSSNPVFVFQSGANLELKPNADDIVAVGNIFGDTDGTSDITPYGIWNKSSKNLQIIGNNMTGVRRLGIRNDVSVPSSGFKHIFTDNIADQTTNDSTSNAITTSSNMVAAGDITANGGLVAVVSDNSSIIRSSMASDTTAGPQSDFRRYRGTQAARLAVQNNDILSEIRSLGWNGKVDVESARIRAEVDANLTSATTVSVSGITRSGTTATVTATSHGFATGNNVAISGATGADAALYNGTFSITVVDANTFTYTMTGTPAASAAGTLVANRIGVAGRMRFYTTPDPATSVTLTERMRITSAGRVGIGTTAPDSLLHVVGDLSLGTASSNVTTSTTATAGTNGGVPAQVAGYLVVSINGTSRKIPYYAT